MTCPAPTATRPPATASQPTRSEIVTTTPQSVRQTRTPKFVKLHNGNMHKHTPESLCILPIDETGCAGRRSPIFVCLPYCDFSFIRRPYCDFPPIPKIPFLYLSSANPCPRIYCLKPFNSSASFQTDPPHFCVPISYRLQPPIRCK